MELLGIELFILQKGDIEKVMESTLQRGKVIRPALFSAEKGPKIGGFRHKS